MRSRFLHSLLPVVLLALNAAPTTAQTEVPRNETTLTAAQEQFLKLKFGLFLHFNMATFVDL